MIKWLFSVHFLLLFNQAFSQDIALSIGKKHPYFKANSYYNASNPTDRTDSLALVNFRLAIEEFLKTGNSDSLLFDAYVKSGIIETGRKQDLASRDLFFQALTVLNKNKRIPDSLGYKPFLFIGSAYYNLNNLDSARYYYRQAEELVDKYSAIEEPERLYNKSGVLYYELGDYRKSIQYFSKALSLVGDGPSAKYFRVNYKNNIASAYRKLKDYAKALEIYKELLSDRINTDELMHNIGITYFDQGEFTKAIQWLKKVGYSTAAKYNDLGRAFLAVSDTSSARHQFDLAFRLYNSAAHKYKDFDYGITLKGLGDLYLKEGQFSQALSLYQKSIIQLDIPFNDSSVDKNPAVFPGLVNSYFLFDVLTSKAKTLRIVFEKGKQISFLENCFGSYQSALLLAAQVENELSSEESRLFLSNNVQSVYQEAISVGIILYRTKADKAWLNRILSLIENSKSSVLQAGLRELTIESIVQLPPELINEEKRLKADIVRAEIQLRNAKYQDRLENQIIDDEIRLSSVQEKLQRNPKYRQLKFSVRNLDIDSLQKFALSHGTVLLSYYFLTDSLICFYIGQRNSGFTEIHLDDGLREHIFLLRRSFSTGEGTDQRRILASSQYLFRKLIGPVQNMIREADRLVIIPHNEISYIPFETLTDPDQGELLIRKLAISYQYSANFLPESRRESIKNYQVLAMAPFASSNGGGNLPLEMSGKEVDQLPGKILIDSEASKSAFLKYAAGFPILHLATHAVADDKDPLASYIEFYSSGKEPDTVHRLYEPEIYRLDLGPVDLVLLSACETGHGKLINGEGVMSLSRAFSYAGCKSVITSLWKADDAATAFIMQKTHAYLQDGMKKDEALRRAKLDYLDNREIDPAHKAIPYWAQFIIIGDTSLVHPKTALGPWVFIGFFSFIALIIYIIKKRPGMNISRPSKQ
jgi:tetratricopeptide (TPR) repeat protein